MSNVTSSADVVDITAVTAAECGLCFNVESGEGLVELQLRVIIFVYITVIYLEICY